MKWTWDHNQAFSSGQGTAPSRRKELKGKEGKKGCEWKRKWPCTALQAELFIAGGQKCILSGEEQAEDSSGELSH